jgi:flagellar M-ring protein FliF
MQHYYENRIKMIITPIIGENKTSISVNANIDFTQHEEAQEEYDPEKKSVRSEQSVIESTSSAGASGVPGLSSAGS